MLGQIPPAVPYGLAIGRLCIGPSDVYPYSIATTLKVTIMSCGAALITCWSHHSLIMSVALTASVGCLDHRPMLDQYKMLLNDSRDLDLQRACGYTRHKLSQRVNITTM